MPRTNKITAYDICRQCGITPAELSRLIDTRKFDAHVFRRPTNGTVNRYKPSVLPALLSHLGKPVSPKLPSIEMSEEQSADTRHIVTKSGTIRTVEEALAHAQVDLSVWEVERHLINSWEMGYKDADGLPGTVPLWQVKVWLRRRIAKRTDDAVALLCERLAVHAPRRRSARYTPPTDPHLLEISIADMHFGKLAWAPETGENYDLHIAEELFERAIIDLLAKAAGFPVERILLPVGNDFMHIDSLLNATAAGTPQDVDGRFAKIVTAGQMALIRAIDRLEQVAPVEVLLVPGNHDQTTSWHTARFLWAYYRHDANVTVDVEHRQRKYCRYGVNLLGFTHGSEEALRALPVVMATEEPASWAATRFHEWHTGHWHKKKETHFTAVDSHEGVIVRALPSLTGRDEWHYSKGYIGNKLAEAYLWSRDRGPSGYVITTGGAS